jgi:hypothetical protein
LRDIPDVGFTIHKRLSFHADALIYLALTAATLEPKGVHYAGISTGARSS